MQKDGEENKECNWSYQYCIYQLEYKGNVFAWPLQSPEGACGLVGQSLYSTAVELQRFSVFERWTFWFFARYELSPYA
jgi:hypothetical protein